jgi:DNA-directed RNA polymerase specialized sigma24 family protein
VDKQELKNYLRMNKELERLEEKMSELRNRLEKPKSNIFSNVPGGERKDFTDYIDLLIDLQEQYSERAKMIVSEQIRIEAAISALDDPLERAVMGYKYVDGLNWEQICVKMNYSWRQTHYIHSGALKNLECLHTIAQ